METTEDLLYQTTESATHKEVQKLKRFVDFIAALKYTPEDSKSNSLPVKELIENIDKAETFRDWCVSLELFDRTIQDHKNKTGIFRRQWCACFSNGILELVNKAELIDGEEHIDEEVYYFSCIDFNSAPDAENQITGKNIDVFVDDALAFYNYLSETMNDIESEIRVW